MTNKIIILTILHIVLFQYALWGGNLDSLILVQYDKINIGIEKDELKKDRDSLNQFGTSEKLFLLSHIGTELYNQIDYVNAERCFLTINKFIDEKEIPLDELKAHSFHMLGIIYNSMSYYNEALFYQSEASRISKDINEDLYYRSQIDLACSYRNLGDTDKALQYLKDLSDKYGENKIGDKSGFWLYYHLGYVYNLKGIKQEAKINYDKARSLLEDRDDLKTRLEHYLDNLYGYYYLDSQKELAADYFNRSLENNKNGPEQICYSYIGLGEVYLKSDDINKAKNEFQKAIKIAKRYYLTEYIIKCGERLYQIAEAQGNVEGSINYLEQVNEILKKQEEGNKIKLAMNKSISLISLQADKVKLLHRERELLETKNRQNRIILLILILLTGLLCSFIFLYKKLLKKEKVYNDNLKKLTNELKETNNDLGKFMNKLAESNTDLVNFASIAAHDIKAPIRIIKSFSEILLRKIKPVADKETAEYLNFIISSSGELSDMVNDLLVFSKVNINLPAQETIDLNSIVETVSTRLKQDIEQSSSLIITNGLPAVQGHYTLLSMLFQNIISNAIKFRKKDVPHTITISVMDTTQDFIKIKISDNGIGIKKEYMANLFDLFKKLHSNAEYKGSGIGLAICRKVVSHYGGEINIQSVFGKGTDVIFTLRFSEDINEVNKTL
jgi:signal transduction histidine kinase